MYFRLMVGVPELLRKIERVIVGEAAGEGKGITKRVVGQFEKEWPKANRLFRIPCDAFARREPQRVIIYPV
jgi:hypothetical protein